MHTPTEIEAIVRRTDGQQIDIPAECQAEAAEVAATWCEAGRSDLHRLRQYGFGEDVPLWRQQIILRCVGKLARSANLRLASAAARALDALSLRKGQ